MDRAIISSREARMKWRTVLDTVDRGTADVVIERYGKPIATIIPYADYEELSEYLEELRDVRFGMAALEGMALGKPVIASQTGGLRELMEHGKTGLFVTPGDPREVADAIESLVTDRDMRLGIGLEGARVARERYPLTNSVAELEKLYEDALGMDK